MIKTKLGKKLLKLNAARKPLTAAILLVLAMLLFTKGGTDTQILIVAVILLLPTKAYTEGYIEGAMDGAETTINALEETAREKKE